MNQLNVLKLAVTVLLVAVLAFFSVQKLGHLEQGLTLGLDLRGGVHLVLQAKPGEDGAPVTNNDMERARSIIENRVNDLGVSEPNIQVDNTRKRIIVELAGIDNPDKAVEVLKTTAKLTFRNMDGEILMDGSLLKDAKGGTDTSNGYPQYVVHLTFNAEGAKIFGDITTAYLGQPLAIYLDEDFKSAPTIKVPILTGQAVITGSATLEEANNQAAMLRSGALPVSMEIIEKRQVGALLGADSMQKSLMACVVGFILVVLFMILYYRLPGLIAGFALVVFAIIVLWILKALGAVLTLIGIAGFVLSLGMTVDLNIIVFERIKEEIAFGKSLRAAVDAGFSRAFMTVFDANITTLFTAAALLFMGSASIRGFALILAIGICTSLFTAVTFTRWVLRWTVGVNPRMSTRLFGVRREA